MVEFAFVFPILLVVAFMIFDFGYAWYQEHVLTMASREGARLASIYDSDSSITNAVVSAKVKQNLVSMAFPGADSVGVSVVGADGGSGDDVTVTLTKSFTYMFIDKFIPGVEPFQMTASTVMRHE